jgi:Zn-dependent peptidase ImmA (M78 family)
VSPATGLADLEAALEQHALDPGIYEDLLVRIRHWAKRYAALERRLLGAVSFPVPEHLLEDLGVETNPETLADRERRRLEVDHHDLDLMTRLDRHGLKVARFRFPEHGDLEGIFLFDAGTGPLLVVDARLEESAADLVFARLYGHFLMDNDPYEIRFARRTVAGEDESGTRAYEFAAALLVGRAELDAYLAAMGWKPGEPLPREAPAQLVVYFDVTLRMILARLLAAGYLEVGELPADLPDDRRSPESVTTDLPERFVRLALEAHARKFLTLPELARALDTDIAGARRLAGRFRLEPGEAESDPRKGPEASTPEPPESDRS